jgi:hypothetical protein
MAQAAEKIIEFPAGGIADFYMEDDEIEALGQLEAEEQFGNKGIANFSVVAERMASYGRHGDDTVAHVETGELVIPKALIEDNPKLRDSIFEHLEELGVEDPERYVVGSGANSINPDTGLPEFFFKKIARAVKKTVKKVSRAVKKVAKSVVKVVKKVAPIVLPIALSFTPLGAIYGAALGSGIGTLIQGGSIKDAFKSALIAGATGAVFKGLGNKLSGQGTFMEGVKKAAANPMGRLTQTASGLGSTLTGGGFTGQGNLFSDFVPTPSVESAVADTTNLASEQLAADTAAGQDAGLDAATRNELYGVKARPAALTPDTGIQDFSTPMDLPTDVPTDVVTGGDSSFIDTAKGYYDKGVDFLTGGTPSQSAIDAEAARLMAENPSVYGGVGGGKLAQDAATKALTPGLVRAYGPSLALAGTAAYAGGFFDAPEEPPQEELQTGTDLIALNPDKYRLPEETPQYAQGPIQVGTDYGIDPVTGRPIVNPFRRPVYGRPVYAAEGGEIFPRRVGGIMPNEGTPGKDSVRAMLMPGEFVMTTDAVKGLGGGNNDRGINRMYDMMRGLEAKGRAMA